MKKIYKPIQYFFQDRWLDISLAWDRIIKSIKTTINIFTDKNRRDILVALRNGYPWDYSYMLDLELAHLKYMREYFKKHQLTISSQDHYEKIDWVVKILESYISGDFEKLISKNEPGILDIPKVDVECTRYVNLRNVDRFISTYIAHSGKKEQIDQIRSFYQKYPNELYREKLWNLYCLIKRQYMRDWWD